MQPEIIVAAGTLLLIYSLFLTAKLLEALSWRYTRLPWFVIFFLVLLSAAGSGYYLYLLMSGTAHTITDSMVGAIIFFASALVLIAVRASLGFADEVAAIEADISQKKYTLESENVSAEKMQSKFEEKNTELDKVLSELYSLRNLMEKNMYGKSAAEMKRMKKILDGLKNYAKSAV